MSQPTSPSPPDSRPLHGFLAEFDAVDPLMAAATEVRRAGFTRWDAHTPFPVHGLDQAMGVRPTKLPFFVLLAGLTGMASALTLQWFCNTYDYPFIISGKPFFSLPAFIPVCFELTVLFSAITAMAGSLLLNGLPALFNPLFRVERFRRATADRFFIYIERRDPKYDAAGAEALLSKLAPAGCERVYYDVREPGARLPRGLPGTVAVLTVATLLPLALIARAREAKSPLPRIHVIPDDMDNQYKFKAQASNWFFADGRAARPQVAGTVAHEDVQTDDVLYSGKDGSGHYTHDFPAQVSVDQATMARGAERFMVYCSVCHGLSGRGDGMVARHADRLAEGTWVTPSSLHDERVRQLPVGDLYNTVAHGVRNMPGYADQIAVADRWAIVMYVRALQLSQHAAPGQLPADVLPTLK